MAFSVRFTGGYGSDSDPQRVALTLANIFGRDAAEMTRLIAARATIKRGVDHEVAERYRRAIEDAGAHCSIDEDAQSASTPLTIDPVPVHSTADVPRDAAPVPPSPQDEVTLFETGPAVASYAGSIALGALLLPAFGAGLIVWLVAFISWKSARYKLTNQRLFARKGWISRQVQELELYRVKDVGFEQRTIERMLGVGTVTVIADDSTTPVVTMPGLAAPETIKEAVRTAYREARRREGVRAAERLID